jgi:hypothetical protein
MVDMVGSAGAMLDPWPGPTASGGQPGGAPLDAADSRATDCDLVWQTTVGQIVFLESVVHHPT